MVWTHEETLHLTSLDTRTVAPDDASEIQTRTRRALARLLRASPWLALAAVALIWLYLFPFNRALNNANERPRVLQARAIVDDGTLQVGVKRLRDPAHPRRGTVVVDAYGEVHGGQFVNDLALVCDDPDLEPPECTGRLYPAKAPGTALLGVPWVWLGDQLGMIEPGEQGEPAATWFARLGVMMCVAGGLIALVSLLRRFDIGPGTRARVLLATALGTNVLPYTLMFVGHATAGAAIVIGLALLTMAHDAAEERREAYVWLWGVLGGFAASASVLLEYHAAIAVAAIGFWTLVPRHRLKLVPAFAIGALAAFAVHASLHEAMFGSPFETGHFHLMSEHNRQGQEAGFLGIQGFHFGAARDFFLDPYMGLVPLMPWLVVGLAAGIKPLRESSCLPRGMVTLWLVVPLLYTLFLFNLGDWTTMNGWAVGPRYLVPAVLPMALVAGVGWHRLERSGRVAGGIIAGLAAASIVILVVLTVAYPSPPNTIENSFADFALPLVRDGYGVRNLGLALGLGTASLKPLWWFLIFVLAVVAVRWWPGTRAHPTVVRAAAACVACALWLVAMTSSTRLEEPAQKASQRGARVDEVGVSPEQTSGFWDGADIPE